jgi:hypothetical protein
MPSNKKTAKTDDATQLTIWLEKDRDLKKYKIDRDDNKMNGLLSIANILSGR